MVSAIVVAAGRGRRMGFDKIMAPLHGKPVLYWSLKAFQECQEVDEIIVVTAALTGTSNFRTLDELQARLDPDVFWRVHRSHLVNINKIKEIVPWFSRNFILRMRDAKSTEIPVSRAQSKRLRDYLQI